MEKYKTIILIEKIKKSLEVGKCQEALEVAERIDKKKLKNLSDISTIAECYFQNGKYEQAKDLFLRMYEKNHSRRIVAQLVHLSIKLQDATDANHYLSEFVQIAPEDFYRYIFQYSIDKMTKAPIVKLIEALEGLKKTEYIESWAYELAKLYHKAGLKDKCVAECNDIVLWFGDGDYVDRAKALRAYYLGELDRSVFADAKISMTESVEDAVTESEEEASQIGGNVENSLVDETDEEKLSEKINEEEISVTLAHEINDIFDQETEIEEKMEEAAEETVLEDLELSESVVDKSLPEKLETEVSVQQESEVENPKSDESESEKPVSDHVMSADQEVEEEIYRLLKEEGIEKLTEAKTVNNENEQWNETNKKPQPKKIELEVPSNEQLIEEEGLLDYFERNDVNLSELFGNYIRMEMVQKQLIRSMDQAVTQNSNINLIITGETKTGKTKLAKRIAKTFNRLHLISSNRVALIDGAKLNKIDLMSNSDQLADCVVIVENAGRVSKETVKSLQKLISALPNRIIIILEDTRENINRLLRANSALNNIFNNRIHLHKYTMQDYMGFAYEYLVEKDYEIDEEAYTILQNKLSTLVKKERENALPAMFSFLDTAIMKSEKRSATQLKEMSESGHFEEPDFMVLKPEDIY